MKTAVEWLIQELNQKIDFISMDKWDMIIDILQQAKSMEKEQIMQSLNDGKGMVLNNIENKSLEQYYKETFKKDQ